MSLNVNEWIRKKCNQSVSLSGRKKMCSVGLERVYRSMWHAFVWQSFQCHWEQSHETESSGGNRVWKFQLHQRLLIRYVENVDFLLLFCVFLIIFFFFEIKHFIFEQHQSDWKVKTMSNKMEIVVTIFPSLCKCKNVEWKLGYIFI